MQPGEEPIDDPEIVFRRVRLSDYDDNGGAQPEAFAPHRSEDKTGISLSRKKYKSIEEAAAGRQPQYYVASFVAGILRSNTIQVEPSPVKDAAGNVTDPGHAEMPQLRSDNRKSNEVIELQRLLAKLSQGQTSGPYPAKAAAG
jgi:hypothetical protein